jgi:hypothetical protein
VRLIFRKTRASLQTNISHCGIIKPWEQNDLIGKLFMTESLGEVMNISHDSVNRFLNEPRIV